MQQSVVNMRHPSDTRAVKGDEHGSDDQHTDTAHILHGQIQHQHPPEPPLQPLHHHRHFISGIGDGNVHHNRDPPNSMHHVEPKKRPARLGVRHEGDNELDKDQVKRMNQKHYDSKDHRQHKVENYLTESESVTYHGHYAQKQSNDINSYAQNNQHPNMQQHAIPNQMPYSYSIADVNEDSWQVSCLALIGIIGVLVALFVNLISEPPALPSSSSTTKSKSRYRNKYHRSDTSLSERAVKKKTDDPTADDDIVSGDNFSKANAVIIDQLSYHVGDGYYRQDLQEPRLRKVPVGDGAKEYRRSNRHTHAASTSNVPMSNTRIESRPYQSAYVPEIGISSSTISSTSSPPSTEKSLPTNDGDLNICKSNVIENHGSKELGIGFGLDGFQGAQSSLSDLNDDLQSQGSSHISYQSNARDPTNVGFSTTVEDDNIDDNDIDCQSHMSGMSSLSLTSRQSLPLGGDIITTIDPVDITHGNSNVPKYTSKISMGDGVPKYTSEISMGDGGGTTDSSLSGEESRGGRFELDKDEETPVARIKSKWNPNKANSMVTETALSNENDYEEGYTSNQYYQYGQQQQKTLGHDALQSLALPDLGTNNATTSTHQVISDSQKPTRIEELQLFHMESGLNEHSQTDHPKKNVDSETEGANGIMHKRRDLTAWSDAASSLTSPISYSELNLMSIIGSGGFGQVYSATWRGTPVAVKVLAVSSKAENVQRAILQEFAAEINMVSGMRHPNITLYIGACLDPPHRAIVTELASNGSLWDALRMPLESPFSVCDGKTNILWPQSQSLPPVGTWPWLLVKRVAVGAARGMAYLHGGCPSVLHRDLKSANILLDDSYNAKITDFGLSRLKAQERSMTGNCGTVQWMAPEILANESYAEPADVYSYGIILWELLSRECPYNGMNSIQCAMAVLNKNARPEIPAWCPLQFRGLIEDCIGLRPSSRPTFSGILTRLEGMC